MKPTKWILLADYEPGLPALGYSLLDASGYEIEKFQFFPDSGTWEFADKSTTTGRTELGDQAIESDTVHDDPSNIGATGPRLWSWTISQLEYDAAKQQHICPQS